MDCRAFPGWAGHPCQPRPISAHSAGNTRAGRWTRRCVSRAGRGRIAVFADRCLLLQETPLVVHRLVEQGPGPSAVPLRVGRPLPEAPISCPARMLWVLDGIRPCLTTSEPRLSVSQWPNSTGARCIGEATQSSISPASGSTSVANKKDGGNNQLAQFGQPKVDVRFFGAEPPRSKQGSRSGLAACSRGTRPKTSVMRGLNRVDSGPHPVKQATKRADGIRRGAHSKTTIASQVPSSKAFK